MVPATLAMYGAAPQIARPTSMPVLIAPVTAMPCCKRCVQVAPLSLALPIAIYYYKKKMKDCGLKIQPLKGIKKTHTKQPQNENLPKLPGRWLFCGRSGSSKSTTLQNMILNNANPMTLLIA